MVRLKRLLLIGRTDSKSAERLFEEAKLLGVLLEGIPAANITFDGQYIKIAPDSQLTYDVMEYDAYFFRGLGLRNMQTMQYLAAFLKQAGKSVTEDVLTRRTLPNDKLVPPSEKTLYDVPRSISVNTETMFKMSKSIHFPAVGKIFESSMGKGVRLLKTRDELYSFVQEAGTDVLLQEYHSISHDTRILVVGEKVLGGFHRYKREGEAFLTTASGGRRERAVLTEAEILAALEAARLQELEIAGVDMFMSNGQINIIEVNASPQFRVFEKIVEVNVARNIIEYILGKI